MNLTKDHETILCNMDIMNMSLYEVWCMKKKL